MQANVGSIDRAMRILIGLSFIAATVLGVIGGWGWLGVIPLVTGMFRYCPAYALFWTTYLPSQEIKFLQ